MMKLRKFVGILVLALIATNTPWALAAPSETGATASDLNSVSNPGFDAKGEALQKVVMKIIGQVPQGVPNNFASKPGRTSSNGINFYGGPVMTSGVKVNIVWYGNWTQQKRNIITNLIQDLNNSAYFNINTTYYDANKNFVKNSLTLGQEYFDSYSQGNGGSTGLSDAQIWTIVNQAASTPTIGSAIVDTNAITLVLTSSDVKKSGFLTSYCGWHTFGTISSTAIKYSFVGDPGTSAGCVVQTISPNGDAGADAMTSVIAHEIEEAVTDPQLNAWFDRRGYENADKCAWNFGTINTLNGFKYNMTMNGRNYYIQQNWLNAQGGLCALSWPL
jgi:hypothetical protein